MTPERRSLVETALAGWKEQAKPYGGDVAENVDILVVAEITKFVTLVATNWSETQRAEYIDQACCEFEDIPVSLLVDAIVAARKQVYSPARLVSWVFEFVDRPRRKLDAEGAVLTRLKQVAEAHG